MRHLILTTAMTSVLAFGTAANAQQEYGADDPMQQPQAQGAQSEQQVAVPQHKEPQIEAMELMEKPVTGPGGERVGEVADVLVDQDGRVRMVVVAQDAGLLGAGEREVAMTFDDVEVSAEGVRVPVTEEEMNEMPVWDSDRIDNYSSIRDNGAMYSGGGGGQSSD